MKKLLITAAASILAAALALGCVRLAVRPGEYPLSLGNVNYTEKITGTWLVEEAAKDPRTVTIFGSSELRTYDILTHPANFFKGERAGFQVNLVGRGSCQSIIHALEIAACGDALAGTKVVLITSPQAYVEGGIAPDLFMANFSEEQYLKLMSDPEIPDEMKLRFSERVLALAEAYGADDTSAALLLARGTVEGNGVLKAAAAPYAMASRWLLETKDLASAKKLIATEAADAAISAEPIDWDAVEAAAVAEAKAATSNNDYGMLDDYYTTYIGRRLEQQKDKDKELSYSVSEEYGDLRLLLDVCKLKGIEPMFVHIPVHGDWSDYTGFSKELREEYYENVREIVSEYDNVTLLDLTGYEYEDYFLCDVMHLGWKGWLEIDKALVEFYNEG